VCCVPCLDRIVASAALVPERSTVSSSRLIRHFTGWPPKKSAVTKLSANRRIRDRIKVCQRYSVISSN